MHIKTTTKPTQLLELYCAEKGLSLIEDEDKMPFIVVDLENGMFGFP